MTKDEALKLALEALEKDPAPLNAINNAKCFLYSALEQPEPFEYWNAVEGWVTVDADEVIDGKAAQKMKQAAMKAVDPQYRDDPEVMFALGWDAGFQARTRRACADCNGMGFVDGVGERCQKCAGEGAEPEQEPVAWSVLDKRTGKHWYTHESKSTAQYYANLYSHRETDGSPSMVVTPLYTASPSKPEQVEKQEPYAYIYETNGPFGVHQSLRHEQYNGRYPDKTIPVYTAPPKQEFVCSTGLCHYKHWVGLTDEEIDYIWGITKPDYEDLFDFPRAIEAKLRAKNGF